MRSGAQPLFFRLTMSAPICVSGSMMRFIGRLWIEASPFKTEVKFCPERMPEISRVVVPLFPVSSVSAGAVSPCRPFPWIRMRSGVFSMSTPSLRKQLIVERQSAPCRKFVTSVVPSASAPNMTARCEMDLSPGTVISPFKGECFLKIIGKPTFRIRCSGICVAAPPTFSEIPHHKIPRAARLPQIHGYVRCRCCRY